jgi:hypothetical protein
MQATLSIFSGYPFPYHCKGSDDDPRDQKMSDKERPTIAFIVVHPCYERRNHGNDRVREAVES